MERMIIVNARGFDGEIRKSWKANLLKEEETLLTLVGVFDAEVDHPVLGVIKSGTISYEYYWPDRWYNVFWFHEPDGSFRNYYCNINMPPTFENGVLDYIDLDIDIFVAEDRSYTILDTDEFDETALIHGFSDELRKKVSEAVEELVAMIEQRQFPFDM